MTDNKSHIRRQMLAKRQAFLSTDREQAETAIQQQLVSYLTTLNSHNIVAGYYPSNGEVNILTVIQTVANDHSLALPSIANKHSPLQFNQWDGEATSLIPGKYNIPTATGSIVQPDIVLVPLVAATITGQRLGYGGGFYDRTIQKYSKAITIGIAFELQIVAELPIEPHDQPLQYLMTENGMIKI